MPYWEWHKDERRIPKNKIVKIKIKYGEVDLGIKIKSFGGIRNRDEGVWESTYEAAKTLGLTDRIVENKDKSNYNSRVKR